MRKDVRYGLGIGALMLAFAVTFLVVRNHTLNEALLAEQESEAVGGSGAPGSVDVGPPEANPAAQAPVEGPASNAAVVLPPLVDMSTRRPDVFDPRPGAPAPVKKTQDWETLLETGAAPGSAPRRSGAGVPAGSAASGRVAGGSSPRREHAPVPQPSGSIRSSDQTVSPRPISPRSNLGATTGRSYTIQDGDTFVSIAKEQYGQSRHYLRIEAANPNVDPSRLRVGQAIILPDLDPSASAASTPSGPYTRESDNRLINPRTEYRVDPGDSLYRISMKIYGSPRMIDEIYAANSAAIGPNPQHLRLGMILKLPQGNLSSR